MTKKFWNLHPCVGKWNSIKKLIEYRNKTEPYIQKLMRKYVKGRKVLEVGCGQGIELIQNTMRGINVVGLDYSTESLKRARYFLKQLGLKARLVPGDAENLPFKEKSFDIVYSIGVLHHTPDTQKGINEIYRVLRKGGKAIVMLYNKYSWKSPFVFFFRKFSKFLDVVSGKKEIVYNYLRKEYRNKVNSLQGTTLLELFGCPILKMYSKKQLKKMFNKFSSLQIKCYSCNFAQLSYFFPFLKIKAVYKLLKKIDSKLDPFFGFHLVVVARK